MLILPIDERSENMKIITFAAIKGGVGKTTICYNFGEFLAKKKNKNILFIDMDNQCSLTQTYNAYNTTNNIGNIFKEKDAIPINVAHNIDIISGFAGLDEIEALIENQTNKNMFLYMWMTHHSNNLSKYDYILLDCHPDFRTATKNSIIVSHAIISPIIPNQYSYDSKENIQERLKQLKKEAIDYRTGYSYVTAKLFFILNMLRNNTRATHELIASVKNNPDVIAKIPQREIFNRSTFDDEQTGKSTSVIDMEKDQVILAQNRKFFKTIYKIFDVIKSKIDNI